MSDRKIRYNRDFLEWDDLVNGNKKYKPNFHIYPTKGLLNDPNCTFFINNQLYCFFQHHPANNLHGLRTMSLAKTKDFINFEYKFMVNKPINDYDSHGVFTGSSIVKNNKIHCLYTGNSRDDKWVRTSSIIKCEYDLENDTFINKKVLINNHEYQNYTEHFRDPYLFEYNNNFYFLLGSQRADGVGVILLFELNQDLLNPILVKEINLSKNFKMIECPNIIFIDDEAYLIYCPQFNDEIIKKDNKISPDICWYSKVDIKELFNLNEFNYQIYNWNRVDYGLEFYAPQTFKINDDWYIVGWVGLPTNNQYKENECGWLNMLSSFRKIEKDNDGKLSFIEPKIYKDAFENSSNKFVKYKKFNISSGESIEIFDLDNKLLEISQTDSTLQISRFNDNQYFDYDNSVLIDCLKENDIEIFIDNSIVEIKINNKEWYTSRIYFDEEISFKENKSMKNNNEKYIIYDIGGTFIKWAIATKDFEIINKGKFPFDCSNRNCNPELVIAIGSQITEFQRTYENIIGVGISTAGDVDINTGKIIGSVPNHKNYIGTNFKDELKRFTNLPIVIDNDANCAVLGELIMGELKNCESGILITLGTDIGGGIVINKEVFRGHNGSAGEVGYMDVLNRRWGTWFSAIGLSRLVEESQKLRVEPEIILKNEFKQFRNEVAYWYHGLSRGIANLIALFNPEKVVIGGGLSESNLIDLKVINKIKDSVLIENHLINNTKIVLSKNGNTSAIYGCVKMLNNYLNK